ncbi:phage tail length tape measure family protein [Mesorhizobium sp.]|uniref:phage tail length tape measure family protein n=1 Tax=Mesorhizobium sp. TaxID=1871066 RepID=UPI0011F73597|nr:phage tail length tape measure family protein [Mesorhizobium sp.]TIN83098.1 MAG: phage tail tape-measure protein [Mesorhizobium sp.]
MASTQEDLARLLVSIELSQAKTEKQAAAIAKAAEKAARSIDGSFAQANDNVAKSFQRGAKAATTSIGQQKAAVTNLTFQLNDIAQGLLTGQSPFRIMAQQGSQVTQALEQAGGGAAAIKALGGAFTQMLNPISLATFAIIGLGGVAVQYFASLLSSGEESEKTLKEHAELIDKVAQKWGDALPALKAYNDEQKRLQDQADIKGAVDAAVRGEYSDLRKVITDTKVELADLLDKLVAAGKSDADVVKLQTAFGTLFDDVEKGNASVDHLKSVQAALTDLYNQSHIPAAKEMATAIGNLADEFERAAAAGQKLRADAALQEFFKQQPLGTLSPLVSGGGQFLNPDQQQTFNANESTYAAAGASAAADMIRGFEGFIAHAKFDVNAFRAGFGSDTITKADGEVQRVTKDTVVTLADAQRDLARRIVDFQSGIQDAIGVDTWNSLNEAQKAALTSIAYNYGQLPKAIVAAIQGGGGPAAVAKAIATLGSDNNGVNKARRNEEAQSFLSGTGISAADAGISTSTKKSPTDIFAGNMQQIQQRIDLLNAEYEAQSKLNPTINDYGYAVEKARIKQQLLNDAAKAGVEITPELAAKIDALAGNYAKASAAGDQLKASQEKLAHTLQESSAFGKDVLGGFIKDMQDGKSATEALSNALKKVADRLLDMGLNLLFDGFGQAGGGGGLLGGLFSFLFANGGIAAYGKPVPLKRFANGGVSHTQAIFGEAGPEAAVPLPDGRRIPVDLRAPAPTKQAGSNDTVRITLQDDSGRMSEIADQRIKTHSGTIVEVAVQRSTKAVKGQMPGLLANAQARSL